MNLRQLIDQFRVEADDGIEPHLWPDEWLGPWFNEAQAEAAVRARLLLDDYTTALCEIPVAAGADRYALHAKVYEIASIAFKSDGDGRAVDLELISREKLDRDRPDWRSMPPGGPRWAIQTDTRLRLVPVPDVAGTVALEAYRLPIKALANDNDKPEIHEAHHLKLVQWVLHRAFGKPDADAHDAGRSGLAYANFERYFGLRPDADLRRATRHDEPQVTAVHTF